jgi:hypothetical protein
MKVNDASRQDRFRCIANNPMVIAALVLGGAQLEV